MVKFSSRDKMNRFKAHYPEVQNIPKTFTLEKMKTWLKEIPESNRLLIKHGKEEMYSLLFTLLIRNQKYESLKLFNAYDVVDIYLGNKEDVGYKCISDIECKILAVYFHGSEMVNKRQEDLLIQLIEQQIVVRGKVWLLTSVSLDSRYPMLLDYLKSKGFEFVDVSKSICEEEEL